MGGRGGGCWPGAQQGVLGHGKHGPTAAAGQTADQLNPLVSPHPTPAHTEGRICLDILNMPPKGGWKPSLSVPTVLASIGLLLAEPNPDDGLVTDIVSAGCRGLTHSS